MPGGFGQILHNPLGSQKPQLVIVFRSAGVVGKTGNDKHYIAILCKITLDIAQKHVDVMLSRRR